MGKLRLYVLWLFLSKRLYNYFSESVYQTRKLNKPLSLLNLLKDKSPLPVVFSPIPSTRPWKVFSYIFTSTISSLNCMANLRTRGWSSITQFWKRLTLFWFEVRISPQRTANDLSVQMQWFQYFLVNIKRSEWKKPTKQNFPCCSKESPFVVAAHKDRAEYKHNKEHAMSHANTAHERWVAIHIFNRHCNQHKYKEWNALEKGNETKAAYGRVEEFFHKHAKKRKECLNTGGTPHFRGKWHTCFWQL